MTENTPAPLTLPAEVLTDPTQVWVIAVGDPADRVPVEVVRGTAADAEARAAAYTAEYYNPTYGPAYVWLSVPLVAPSIQ
ncbi:hypothetical protein [Nocardia bovistercoris]|uniref:Uncharacterized protein n=1 Tax=Nocardia bovistercoris TaxID=2785916 RepID=A0A931I6Z9_9NOCA|nr:hypothetical protein [Nocardia bovistercoris]MBH0775048.1 hypothetical protein [Nocardia bovistercoris]